MYGSIANVTGQVDDFNATAKRLEDNGCAVRHPVHVPDVSSLPDSIHLART